MSLRLLTMDTRACGDVLCAFFPGNIATAVVHLQQRDAATASAAQQQSPLERSKALNRPLSPDLKIYQPQLTWVLSGAYRVSSVVATTGASRGGPAARRQAHHS